MYPKEYGGTGMDYNTLAIVCAELSVGILRIEQQYPFILV